MKTEIDENIEILNGLIEQCADGAAGFETAAAEVGQPELEQVFRNYAKQRRDLIAELRRCVRSLGGEPKDEPTVKGKLHRGWVNLRQALTTKDAHAVLAECERGEDAAVVAYQEALALLEEPELREVVTRQFVRVKAAHDSIRDLRDSPTYASQ